jgi:hypothetical protein
MSDDLTPSPLVRLGDPAAAACEGDFCALPDQPPSSDAPTVSHALGSVDLGRTDVS